MKQILLFARFFVGRTTMSGQSIDFMKMKSYPNTVGIEAYTLIPCKGWYHGKPEDSVIIEVHHEFPRSESDTPKEFISEVKKLNVLAEKLRTEFDQEMVITDVVVRSGAKRIEWTHCGITDSGEVFPLPAHLASLVWDCLESPQVLDMPGFFKKINECAKEQIGSEFILFDDLPLLIVPATNGNIVDLGQVKEYGQKEKDFDKAIVRRSQEKREKFQDRFDAVGRYISDFRRASRAPVFFAGNMDTLLSPSAGVVPPIDVQKAPYMTGLGCSEIAYYNMLQSWLENNSINFDRQKFLNFDIPMVTVLALTHVEGEKKVLIRRRGENVGIYPNLHTCVPWGHLEPFFQTDPSVLGIFLQELDEELLGGPSVERDFNVLLQRLRGVEGKLLYKGYVLDLLRPLVHILLEFKASKKWWDENRSRMRLNWEYKDEDICYEDIEEIAGGTLSQYAPVTVAAARLVR